MTRLLSQTANTGSGSVDCRLGKRQFLIAAITEKGTNKRENQDAVLIRRAELSMGSFVMLAVVDGIGGLPEGARAGQIAVQGLSSWWDAMLKEIEQEDEASIRLYIDASLGAAISAVNASIFEQAEIRSIQCGTTITALIIHEDWYCIRHAGDSRAYRLDGQLHQLTEDHNLLNEYKKAGRIRDEDVLDHKLSNIITNCLGIRPTVDLHECNGFIGLAEGFILCSDGFYKSLAEFEIYRDIKACITKKKNLRDVLLSLLQEARARGEKDDISVIAMIAAEENR